MRIVSLLPAATEIVGALGLHDQLVGRSHQCDFPRHAALLPALTRPRIDSSLPSRDIDERLRRIAADRLPLYMLDEAQLARLAPDIVITQSACEVCAVSYHQVVGALKRTAPHASVVSLQPARLADVLADVVRVAGACGAAERGQSVAAHLADRLAAIPRPSRAARVAVVEWLEPLMLAGHWVPDVIEAAGGTSVGPTAGLPSPYVGWEELERLAPEAIVVSPCGFDLARTMVEVEPVLARLQSLTPEILLCDGNAYLNRPGPRLVDAAEAIGSWLRGERLAAGFGATPARTAVSGLVGH